MVYKYCGVGEIIYRPFQETLESCLLRLLFFALGTRDHIQKS